jgi:hypothetical protein
MQDACTMHMHRQTDRQTDIHRGQLPARLFFKLRAREEKPLNESNVCVICEQTAPAMACQRCQTRIGHHLDDIVTFTALAADELLPGQGGDGRSSERGIGIRIDALDLVAGYDVLPVLESWERMFREEWGYGPWGPTSAARGAGQADQATAYLTGTVRFLREHLDRISEHPAVDDFAGEITTCWHQARQAARRQPRQAWRVTCPSDTDQGECGQTLRVTGQDFGGQVTCRACGTVWLTDRLLMVVASSLHAELWLDPEAASEWVGVHVRTLRKWANAGKIKREHGRYEVHSLRQAISEGVSITA